jgi:hypothetical protein
LVTALYDIDREKKGDGRAISDYLKWISETLKLKSSITLFTESKFEEQIKQFLKRRTDCNVIIEEFNELPFYKKNDEIKKILQSDFYKQKMKDTKRIECYMSEYNVIQYSKFDWLERVILSEPDFDYYFWIDAGISRFFDGFDTNKNWPNTKVIKDKIIIQGNYNFINLFDNMEKKEYIWDNRCMLSGGLFGGTKNKMIFLKNEIHNQVNFLIQENCFNNEQILFPIILKDNPELFDIFINYEHKPMPIFKYLS